MKVRRMIAGAGLSAGLAVGSLALAVAPASASIGKSGPYTYTGPDQGTCAGAGAPNGQNSWASDLGHRSFSVVNPNPHGDYNVTETFSNGKWSSLQNRTLSPSNGWNYSPGDCDGSGAGGGTDAGHRLKPGSQGTFTGTEKLFIENGSYTAGDGTCAGTNPDGSLIACDTNSYVSYHYGSGAQAILTGYTFTYKSAQRGMIGRKYVDHGTSNNQGQTFTYHETGDVYNARTTPVN